MLAQLDEFNSSEIIALDTETTGVEQTDKPFGFSVASHEKASFFDARSIFSLWDGARSFLTDSSKSFVLQNPKFDMRMLDQVGCLPTGKCYDLSAAARLVRNDHQVYSLAAQAKRYGMEKGTQVEAYIKANKCHSTRKDRFGEEYKNPQYDMVPPEIIAEYAAHDARITKALWDKYMERLSSDEKSIVERDARLVRVCYQMEKLGVKLNESYTTRAMYHEMERVDAAKTRFKSITGQDFVNSAKALQKVLTISLPTTAEGNPSLTDGVIESLAAEGNDKEVLSLVRTIREADKRVGTYYKNYINLADSRGVIHPSMHIGGTRTGRFSYSEPNLQNLHADKNSNEEFVVRGCFIPRSGNAFLSVDYSQMEYRLAAAYANAKGLIEQLNAGADFHKATAQAAGIDRDTAKTLSFAILYGAGDAKVAVMLGISTDEARRLRYRYFAAMPEVEELIANVQRKGQARGFVYNWRGRKLYAEREYCYALPNHLIQSSGADVVKDAMVTLADELPHIPMVLQVHDELVFEAPEAELMEAIPKIKAIMEGAWPGKNGLRLPVSAAISTKTLAKRDFKEV